MSAPEVSMSLFDFNVLPNIKFNIVDIMCEWNRADEETKRSFIEKLEDKKWE